MSVESGELRLNVVADTSGLSADLRAKLARVRETVSVDVKLNTTQLRAELARASRGVEVTVTPKVDSAALRSALAAATRDVKVNVTPTVNTAELRAALDVATRGVKVNARVDFDRAQVKLAFEAATAGLRFSPAVDIDRNKLFHDVRNAIVLAMSNLPPIPVPSPGPAPVPVPGGGGGAGAADSSDELLGSLGSVSKAATLAVGKLALFQGAGAAILGVVGALTDVVAGLFAVAAASAPAVGALAAIPAALGGAVQVAGTLVAAFKGVGSAVQGLQEKQQNAGKTAKAVADAQKSGAEQVAAAQKRLATAYDGVGSAAHNVELAQRAARDAAEGLASAQEALSKAQQNVTTTAVQQDRAVAQAETNVKTAQQAAKAAQDALTAARKTATQQLQDYQDQLADAALNEEGAQIAIERAREALDAANKSPTTSALDKKEADLNYREALQRYQELLTQNKRLSDSAKDAAKKGVEGSDAVTQATANAASASDAVVTAQQAEIQALQDRQTAEKEASDAVVAAQRNVRDSTEGLADANYNLAQSSKDQIKAQQEIVDAQKNLAQTQADTAAAIRDAGAATDAAALAYNNASPAVKRFADYLVKQFIPVLKRVQDSVQAILLPQLQTALGNLTKLEGPVTGALDAMATSLGQVAVNASELFSSASWQRDIQTIGKSNADIIGNLGTAALNLAGFFKDITVAAGPMLEKFSAYLAVVTGTWQKTTDLNRENGSLKDFFDKTQAVIEQWARIIGNIFTGIGNIGKAAAPAGQELLNAFEGSTEQFVTWTSTNSDKIKGFFDAIVPTVKSVGGILVGVVTELAAIGENPHTQAITDLIRTKLLPAVDGLVDSLLNSGSGEVFVGIITDLFNIAKQIVDTGVLGKVLDVVKKILDKIQDFGKTHLGKETFSGILALAAIGGPLGIVASAMGNLYGFIAKIVGLPSLGSVIGKLPGVVRGAAGALGKGGLIGLGAGVAGTVAGSIVEDGHGGARDAVGAGLKGAGAGAGIGATVGAGIGLIGGPIGAGAGAAIGAGVGAIYGLVQANGGVKKTFDDIQGAMQKGFDKLDAFAQSRGVNIGNLLKHPFEEFPNVVKAVADGLPGLIRGLGSGTKNVFDWIGEKAHDAVETAVTFIGQLPVKAINVLTLAVEHAPQVFDWILHQAADVIKTVVETFTNFVEHPVQSMNNLGDFLINVGEALFSGISDIIGGANNIGFQILKGIFDGLGNVYEEMKPALHQLEQALYDSGKQISAEWNSFWDGLKQYLYGKLVEIVTTALTQGAKLYTTVNGFLSDLGKLWNQFWESIRSYAAGKINDATTGISKILTDFQTGISRTLGNIGSTWDTFWEGLKQAAATPINAVINTVINGGIGGAWRTVDKFLGDILPNWTDVADVHFARGGVMPGYTPGRDVHQFYSPTAGMLGLSGGEAIMRPEWTRAVGGPQAVEAMNAAARSGGVSAVQGMLGGAFANGGVWQRFADGGVARVLDFGKWLRTQGYNVGENKALGDNPQPGVHAKNSYHYRDDNSGAIDVNHGAGTSLAEQVELAKAVTAARSRGGLRTYFFASDGSHEDHAHFDYGSSGDNVQTSKMPPQVAAIIKSASGGGLGSAISGLWEDAKKAASSAANALVSYASNLPIVKTITDMASSLTGQSVDGVNLKSAAVGTAQSLIGSVQNFLSDKIGNFLGSNESAETAIGNLGSTSYGAGTGSANAAEYAGETGKLSAAQAKSAARALLPQGWSFDALDKLWTGESNWSWSAENKSSGAYGIPQALPGSKMAAAGADWRTNAVTQIKWGLNYIKSRPDYGNSQTAYSKWLSRNPHWYSQGGVIPALSDGGVVKPRNGGTLALLAEKGRSEAVVDEGELNKTLEAFQKLADKSGKGGTVFQPGAVVFNVTNPVPETASKSASDRLRAAAAFGIFDQS